jgi:2,3-bisphosphoglycerate-independent phosphoglycerate mutase
MQYALIILEGAIDESVADLDGLTPLEAAGTPNIDAVARAGRVGLCAASPTGMRPTSTTATMSLLGCDPSRVEPAMGPLTALARGVETGPDDRIWRLSFLSAPGGVVASPSVESVDAPEARALIAVVVGAWRSRAPDLASRFVATAVDATGCVLIERGGAGQVMAGPALPIDMIGAHWRDGVPTEHGASSIARLVEIGAEAMAETEVNRARRSAGETPIDVAWIWGGGASASPGRGFAERFAMRGGVIAGSEHAIGVGRLMGFDRVPAPMGDDLASLGEASAGALDRYDLVIAHVRTPASASILGDAGAKVRAIEEIDSLVVGPALRRLDRLDQLGGGAGAHERGGEGFRIMIAATAEVSCVDRGALDFPNLVTMGGTWMEGQVSRRLTERDAAASDLRVEPGHEILEYFLLSGLHVQTRKPTRAKQTGG